MYKLKYLIYLLLIISLIPTCKKNSVPDIEIMAKVGDEYLTRDELLSWMPPNIEENQKDIVARQYIDRWVNKTVVSLTAQNDGYELNPYEQWSISNLKKDMIAKKYLDAKLPKNIIVTDEEISSYYEENKEEFIRDEDEVHIVQLFLENLDRAIAEEIKELKSLQKVIEKNYLDSQFNRVVEKNGDLGYVPVSSIRKEIVRLVRNGSTGRIYGPIKIESGYYYFQMMDKQKSGSQRSLDLVNDEIKFRLTNIKRRKLKNEIIQKIALKYKIQIFPEHIK
jgi:parvulin-like peptidyl-prolyl isomerase